MTPGMWSVWTPGALLAGFMLGTTKQCYILYIRSGPHGFREEYFLFCFSHYKSMGVHDSLGRGKFGPQGFDWPALCKGPMNITTYKIYKLWASWFQKGRFF